MTATPYIIDHNLLDDEKRYICFAIATNRDGVPYIYQPQIMQGWQGKRYMNKCYAYLELPTWNFGKEIFDE